MTRRRFYAPPSAFSPDGQSATLGTEETRHLRDVLRLRQGDEIYVFDGAGREFRAAVQTIKKDSTELTVVAEREPMRPESRLDLTLAIVLLKHEKFDLVIQKATELGVRRVIPLNSERADVRPGDSEDADKRVTRWRRIALEAAKQSGRARLPEIMAPQTYNSLLMMSVTEDKEPATNVARIMFSEREGKSLPEATRSFPEQPNEIVALIGPEGGWTDEEIELARASGWEIVTLGGRTLRAETAAIVVLALLQHRFGDLV